MTCRSCDLCGQLVETSIEIAYEPSWCQASTFLCRSCRDGQFPAKDALTKMGHFQVARKWEGDFYQIQDHRYPRYDGRRLIMRLIDGKRQYSWLDENPA